MSSKDSGSSSVSAESFSDYSSKVQSSALKATRNAASLPADIDFYRSLDTGVAQQVDTISSRVLGLTNILIQLSASVNPGDVKGKGKATLKDEDDVVTNFHSLVVDSMDQMFEQTDVSLDQVLGRNKTPAIAINPPAAKLSRRRKKSFLKDFQDQVILHHDSRLAKPQPSFKRKVDNSETPWYPSLSHKYHAKVPLGHVYTLSDEDVGMDGNHNTITNHPYQYEIDHISYPSHIYHPATPVPPLSLAGTPYSWVATPESLQDMLRKLRTVKEIAVDLEHHSYRSYAGFLCLMQISTRDEDFVVDVIALRDEMETLNKVFTDPKIVKVFHGAESDIVWLQQDFNVYVVNMFDTFHASKLLEFPRHGLANLMEMYCDYIPDKRYQLADWRIRPLPGKMLEYARSDTHYLLFIYDNLRNALIDKAISRSRSSSPPTVSTIQPSNPNTSLNTQILSAPPSTANASTSPAHTLINHVLARSAETCLRCYTKEPYDRVSGSGPSGWDTLAKKWNKPSFTALGSYPPGISPAEYQVLVMQKTVYRAVHWWRERTARKEDDSTQYVLPNQYLFLIADAPPGDLAALLRVFGSQVPPVVKKRAQELLEEIQEAVNRSLLEVDNLAMESAEKEQVEEKMEGKRIERSREGIQTGPVIHANTESLWGSENANNMIREASSLFKYSRAGAFPSLSGPRIYSSSQSTLFGNGRSAAERDGNLAKPSRFQELAERISRTLVVAPSIPKVATSTAVGSPSEAANTSEVLDDATGMQIEIPFVPAAQRQNASVLEVKEKDTVVVVGKPKTKKRKRTKSTNEIKVKEGKGDVGEVSSVPDGVGSEATKNAEVFDFASVPNILDDNPDTEDRKPVKKKQKKGKGDKKFVGDFPATPRAHSEFKGGNVSHTFK